MLCKGKKSLSGTLHVTIQGDRFPRSASADLYCGVIVSPGKNLGVSGLGLEKAKWAMGQDPVL